MTPEQVSGNVTRRLVNTIGGAIVRAECVAGDRLPTEAEMSQQYGTSRTVTREAIKMLTAMGLVKSWPRRGTMVQDEALWNLMDPNVMAWFLDRRVTASLLKDFLNMRLAIEPAAASMAASRRSNTAEIEAALKAMRDAAKGMGDPVDADSAFHAAVLRASGNRFFAQLAPLVATALRMTVRVTNQLKGVKMASVEDHERVLIAISKGNPRQAQVAISSMIQEALNLIESSFPDVEDAV